MSMRDSIKSLGGSGASSYVANDMVVDQLVARTRRTRAVRQASTTLVSAISAITLGVLAAQLFVSNVEDPAFRDRNLINDDASTSIQQFYDRFGGIPSRANEPVDLTEVKVALKAAAVQETTIQGLKAKSATQGVAAQRLTEAEKQAAAEEQARLDAKAAALKEASETGTYIDYQGEVRSCEYIHWNYPKHYDCATGGYNHWGEGEKFSWNGSQWVCSGQNRGYAIYNCSTGYWDATGDGTEYDWFNPNDDRLRGDWARKADYPDKWKQDEFGNWVKIG